MANPKKTTTQLNTWEQRMAESAKVAAKAESKSVVRPYFSTNGQIKFQGAVLQHGAPLVVIDDIHANLFYDGVYDPNTPTPPDCYAFGRDVVNDEGDVEVVGIDTWDGRTAMAPHKECKTRVHDQCEGCPLNEWASGTGKGKACQNTRRLAAIPAGTMSAKGEFVPFTKPEQFEAAQVGYVKVPVTSTAGLSKLIMDTAKVLDRPLWSMATLMTSIPNPSGRLPQFVIQFEQLDKIPNNLMDSVFKRREAQLVGDETAHPFAPKSATAAAPAPTKGRTAPKRKYT